MRAISAATSVVRHALGAFGEAFLVALIIATLLLALAPIYRPADFLAGTERAAAAKGGQGKGGANGGNSRAGSLSVVVLDGADLAPNHRERITFDVVTSATDRPFVGLKCWQGSVGVYNNSIGVFDTYLFDPWLVLDSVYWASGIQADCTARLYYYNRKGAQVDLASIGFAVGP